MNPVQRERVDLGAEGETLFDLLQTALAAGDGFELFFVCSASDLVLDEIQRRLESNPPPGNTLLWLIYDAAKDLKNVLPDLLSDSSPPEGRRAVWVRARGASDELAAAWTKTLIVLNEQRNRIIAQQPCALILAGPPQLALITQERAPDLWSVRSSVFLMPISPTKDSHFPTDTHHILDSGPAFAGDLREGEYYHNLAEALAGSRGKAGQISRFNLLLRAAEAWTRTGTLEKAMDAGVQADHIARDYLKDDVSQARALYALGHVELRRSEYSEARRHTETALKYFVQTGEQAGEAAAWHQLASIDVQKGNYADARSSFAKALEIRQVIGDRAGEATTWHNIATIDLNEGNYADARRHTETALEHFVQGGGEAGEAATWHQLASIDLEEGNFADARRNFEKALEMRQAIGDHTGEAATWHQLASLDLVGGDYSDARRNFEKALEMRHAIGDRAGEAVTWHNIAAIDLNEGKLADARQNFAKALELRQAIGDRAGEAVTLAMISIAAWEVGQRDVAIRLCFVAHGILAEIGSAERQDVLNNLTGMARKMGLDQDGFETMRKEAEGHYQKDRCASLVRATFDGVSP